MAALQRVIVDCGAHEAVETMIAGYYDEAMTALAGPSVSAAGREGLDGAGVGGRAPQHLSSGQHLSRVSTGSGQPVSGQHQGEGRILGGALLQHGEDALPGSGRATANVA